MKHCQYFAYAIKIDNFKLIIQNAHLLYVSKFFSLIIFLYLKLLP